MIEFTALNVLLVGLGLTVWVLGLTLGIIGLAEITARLSGHD